MDGGEILSTQALLLGLKSMIRAGNVKLTPALLENEIHCE